MGCSSKQETGSLPSCGACILERKIIVCSSEVSKERDVQPRDGRDGLLVCGQKIVELPLLHFLSPLISIFICVSFYNTLTQWYIYHYIINMCTLGASQVALSSKEIACQCRRCKRHRSDPQARKIPWRMAWQPTLVFLPRESCGQGSLVGYGPKGHKESDMTEVTQHTRTRVYVGSCMLRNYLLKEVLHQNKLGKHQPYVSSRGRRIVSIYKFLPNNTVEMYIRNKIHFLWDTTTELSHPVYNISK